MSKLRNNHNKARNRRIKIRARVRDLRSRLHRQDFPPINSSCFEHKISIELPPGYSLDPLAYGKLEDYLRVEAYLRTIKPIFNQHRGVLIDGTNDEKKTA